MHNLSQNTSGMVALTRVPSPEIGSCELTYLARTPIDYCAAVQQHAAYVQTLRDLRLKVLDLSPLPELPDSTFVEDTALVLDEVAVLASPCRPRRSETESVRHLLSRYRQTAAIGMDARLEGGDVLRDGRTLYVGQSTRTDANGLLSLRGAVSYYGYRVVPVQVRNCLHLSTAASCLERDTFLVNPDWIDTAGFAGKRLIKLPKEEPWAANVLNVGGCIVLPSKFPRTSELLDKLGYTICAVDVSELLKAEAGVSCMVLVFEGHPAVWSVDHDAAVPDTQSNRASVKSQQL